MNQLSNSEWLLYGGIAIMVVAIILAVLCCLIFMMTGRKLKKKLEQEFGSPRL